MKITKRELRKIIREERRRIRRYYLMNETADESEDESGDDETPKEGEEKEVSESRLRYHIRKILREGRFGAAAGPGFGGWSPNRKPDFAKAWGSGAHEYRGRPLYEQPISGEQAKEMSKGESAAWPRVDWNDVSELTDLWADMELKAWERDPSNTKQGDLSDTDAKQWWAEQVESAALSLEADLTVEIRKLSLRMMKEFSDMLMNGDYE